MFTFLCHGYSRFARFACRPRDFTASLSRTCRLCPSPSGPKPGWPQCAPAECGAAGALLKSLSLAKLPGHGPVYHSMTGPSAQASGPRLS